MIVQLVGEKVERLCEINCLSLGFHAILDMRDMSSMGRTHSCILDKGDRKSTRLNSSHLARSRMPSSA